MAKSILHGSPAVYKDSCIHERRSALLVNITSIGIKYDDHKHMKKSNFNDGEGNEN